MFHELGVGAVVHDIGPKDGRGQFAVDLLSIDIFQLSIQNKLVALGPEINGGLLAQENESKDVTVLTSALDLGPASP